MNNKENIGKFEEIVKTHQEKVRNTCFRFVKNVEDADDVAQEVFIQAYESLSHFRNDAELSTWIYRIAVNKSLDFLRWNKRKKRYGQIKSIFGLGGIDENEEIQIPILSSPGKVLEDSERREILDRVIDNLPENQKAAITLSKYKGFNNKEISKILGLSLSSVESLIHRAKKNLHKQLYNYFEKQIL